MKLVKYDPWHFEYLAMPMNFGKNMGMEIVKMYAKAYYLRGYSYSIEDKGKIIGCAGVVDMWPGVAEAWTLLSDEAKTKPFFLHRLTLRIMKNIIQTKKYRRVQAIVCWSDPVSVKWIERLGFIKESIMKQFGADGSDHAMYVWSG